MMKNFPIFLNKMISFSLILLSMFAHIGGCLKEEKQNSQFSHSISSQRGSGSSSTPVRTTSQKQNKVSSSETNNKPLNLNDLGLYHYQIGNNAVKCIEDAL